MTESRRRWLFWCGLAVAFSPVIQNLAEKLRVANLDKQVFKAPCEFTRLRELSRIHMTLVRDVVRAQSRIKSLYRSRGVMVTGLDVYNPRRRGAWQKQLCSSAQTRATRLYDHLDFLLEQKKQAEADLVGEAKKHPIVRILETAPGFGPIRTARLVPIVVTPHRFRTKRQFWSYCGLGIVTRSRSDWVQTADGAWIKARVPQTRSLSRQHNRVLKSLFKGAATTVITQSNKDPIHARYERLLDGGTKPAIPEFQIPKTRCPMGLFGTVCTSGPRYRWLERSRDRAKAADRNYRKYLTR